MKLKFSKKIYPKTALIKAAYMFTDRAYIHLDADDDSFFVDLTMKDSSDTDISKEFENELISQSARYIIGKKTKTLREIMLARAVASSVMMNDNFSDDVYNDEEVADISGILTDWFDSHEKG